MLSIRFSDIPEQYHESDLYREFLQNRCDEDEEDEIQVPARCFKLTYQCDNLEDLRGILQVIGYWGWNTFPFSILNFCSQHDVAYWRQVILDERNDQYFLLQLFSKDDNTHPLERALRYDALTVEIEHLVAIYSPQKSLIKDACSRAVQYGRRWALELLHENGYPWDDKVTLIATRLGRLDCLQYSFEQNCPIAALLVDIACERGHLSCLTYLHQQGLELSIKHTMSASSNGKLDCLKYLHENNCPWDASATDGAAASSHHECLSYLCANNCPVDIEITITAARSGSVECMEILLDDYQLTMPTDGTMIVMAVVNARLPMVEYLLGRNTSLVNYIYFKNQILDHYRSLDSTQYPLTDIAEHDENFMKCIVLAVQQGWVCNIELIRLVDHCRENFPLTTTYMLQQGWIVDN